MANFLACLWPVLRLDLGLFMACLGGLFVAYFMACLMDCLGLWTVFKDCLG